MKLFIILLAIGNKIMEALKFSKIGGNAVTRFPTLLSIFKKDSDSDLMKFIARAIILKDRNGKFQIKIFTTNGWEFLDYSDAIFSELSSLLGDKCLLVNFDDVAEWIYDFQNSLNNLVNSSKDSLTTAFKKNKI